MPGGSHTEPLQLLRMHTGVGQRCKLADVPPADHGSCCQTSGSTSPARPSPSPSDLIKLSRSRPRSRSVPVFMLGRLGPFAPLSHSSSFPTSSAARTTPTPSPMIPLDNSSAAFSDSGRRSVLGEIGPRLGLISIHHMIGRLVLIYTTGSSGRRWFEVEIWPSNEVVQSIPSQSTCFWSSGHTPRFHFKPSVLT